MNMRKSKSGFATIIAIGKKDGFYTARHLYIGKRINVTDIYKMVKPAGGFISCGGCIQGYELQFCFHRVKLHWEK